MLKKLQTKSSCKCQKSQTMFELDKPIEKEHLQLFQNTQFTQAPNYTRLGLVYLESGGLIAHGSIGSSRIQVKCKNNKCDNDIIQLEDILKRI